MEAAAEETPKDNAEQSAPDNNAAEKTPTPPPQEPPKKSNKKEDRLKKDSKNIEYLMKSLNSLPTLEEKFSQLCKMHIQSADDNKSMQFYIKQSDKRYALLLKEKEQLQLEFNKTVLVKSKLENLCRELQKQNKAIKEESLLKIREEEERRKETQAKFQNTLSEITTLLQQNNEKNAKLRDDNISMGEKFKSVVQQYQLREQQVDKMAKQMSLESQLSEAKLQKANLEHQAERERLLAEMEQLKVTVAQYRAKVMELQGNETGLRSQLAVYTDKYDEFQNALVKSNQVFGGFKEEMEKMSKKIKKLEKESLSWKKKYETSQSALLDMCSERQSGDRQLAHMQSLCRTLQAERTLLVNSLKEHNIERPPLPPIQPAPAALPASDAKVDAMAANCVQLRQSLAHLQSQLNVLTNKQTEESPKPENKKKSKSKKNKEKPQRVEKADVEKDSNDNVPKETEEKVPSANVEVQNEISNSPEEKVDDKTLESLIQAISNANINLSDLEVVNDDKASNKTDICETTNKIVEIVEQKDSLVPNSNVPIANEPVEDRVLEKVTDAVEINEVSKNLKTLEAPVVDTVASEVEVNDVNKLQTEKEPVAKLVSNEVENEVSHSNSNEVAKVLDDNSDNANVTSNEEIAHIAEVKPISNEA